MGPREGTSCAREAAREAEAELSQWRAGVWLLPFRLFSNQLGFSARRAFAFSLARSLAQSTDTQTKSLARSLLANCVSRRLACALARLVSELARPLGGFLSSRPLDSMRSSTVEVRSLASVSRCAFLFVSPDALTSATSCAPSQRTRAAGRMRSRARLLIARLRAQNRRNLWPRRRANSGAIFV